MSTTQHPLTETAATQMWSTASRIVWIGLPAIYRPGTITALRAAFDAGREHERATPEDRPAEITDEMVEAGASYAWEEAHPGVLGWNSLTEHHKEGCRRDVRNVLSAALAVAAPAEPLARTLLGVPEDHGAPHHDAKEIKPGDYVAQVDDDGYVRAGKAHYQDGGGDWIAEGQMAVTWKYSRSDRPDAVTVWPAPTPPAVEVELPSMHPAHLRDVEGWDGERFAYMALDGGGHWCGVDQDGVARVWPLRWIAAFTLPDGTRVRRDGERPDGEPRFVKTQEGEK